MKLKYWFLALCGCPALMGGADEVCLTADLPCKKRDLPERVDRFQQEREEGCL